MKKTEFINKVAESTGYKKSDIKEVINAMRDVVWDTLRNKEELRIFDGLTVKPHFVEERVCRNPQTGETMTVPAKYLPKARFGQKLKEYINE